MFYALTHVFKLRKGLLIIWLIGLSGLGARKCAGPGLGTCESGEKTHPSCQLGSGPNLWQVYQIMVSPNFIKYESER